MGEIAQRERPAQGAALTKALADINTNLRRPVETYDRLASHMARARSFARQPVPARRLADPFDYPDVMRYRELLSGTPRLPELSALKADLARLAASPSRPAQIRLILGLMVDAFPNARPHAPEVFLETLTAEIVDREVHPAILATACAQLVSACKFVPTVAEILERIGSRSLDDMIAKTEETIAARHQLERVGEEAKAIMSERGERFDGLWPAEIRRQEDIARPMPGHAGSAPVAHCGAPAR